MIKVQTSARALRAGILLSLLVGTAALAADPVYLGGSKRLDRYSPLDQINRSTVAGLKVVWERPSVDASITSKYPDISPSPYLYGTPLVVDDMLYAPNAIGLVEAFEAQTGRTRWVQQPAGESLAEVAGSGVRTVAWWAKGSDRRIISMRGEYLHALDAATGQPIAGFGDKGRVWLDRGTPDKQKFIGFNGPIVVGDVIVVGGNGGGKAGGGYGDGGTEKDSRPENIRGYDVRTGKKVWEFDILPKAGQPGRETWGAGSADIVGNMGQWAPMSADEALGIVYVPLTAPTNPSYGGHRPGDNLYSNSLVALDARTGRKVWHYQMVHHDLWDSDNASAPALGDIRVNGRVVKAVMQPNKNGFLFVLNRVTGKPVWPIVERAVPQSTVPGEITSPTQPFPTKPPAFDRQGVTEDDLIDFTPEIRQKARELVAEYEIGPLFTPPSLISDAPGGKRGTLGMPGAWGSANWNTGAFDPETGVYYAVSMSQPGVFGVSKAKDGAPGMAYVPGRGGRSSANRSSAYGIGPEGLPLLKPPYGRITALDLNKGDKLWTVANGDGPRDHPLLKDLNLPPLGTIGRPAALVTKSLLFVGESSDVVLGAGIPGEAKFRAFDKASGQIVWETTLPAGTTSGPVSYMAGGKQYVVVAIGSAKAGAKWVAMAVGN
jgi:quinoprotein glucose dehydrogenase